MLKALDPIVTYPEYLAAISSPRCTYDEIREGIRKAAYERGWVIK